MNAQDSEKEKSILLKLERHKDCQSLVPLSEPLYPENSTIELQLNKIEQNLS